MTGTHEIIMTSNYDSTFISLLQYKIRHQGKQDNSLLEHCHDVLFARTL